MFSTTSSIKDFLKRKVDLIRKNHYAYSNTIEIAKYYCRNIRHVNIENRLKRFV